MGFFRKTKHKNSIVAQQTGKAVLITEMPDPVFSGKVLGDGVAFIPNTNEVLSPVNGTIVQIADTFHALGIKSDDGLEILIHLGIDTVKLNGKGFVCHVVTGQHICVGEKLVDMDCDYITSQGYNTISCCIITNLDVIDDFSTQLGTVRAAESSVINYHKK